MSAYNIRVRVQRLSACSAHRHGIEHKRAIEYRRSCSVSREQKKKRKGGSVHLREVVLVEKDIVVSGFARAEDPLVAA